MDDFVAFPAFEPPHLLEGILARVHLERRRSLRRHVAYAAVGTAISLLAFALAWPSLSSQVEISGFFAFIKLALTDWDVLVTEWRGALEGAVESFPVFPALIGLIVVSACLWLTDALRTLFINGSKNYVKPT